MTEPQQPEVRRSGTGDQEPPYPAPDAAPPQGSGEPTPGTMPPQGGGEPSPGTPPLGSTAPPGPTGSQGRTGEEIDVHELLRLKELNPDDFE
ncbi:hypothetical protein [Thermoactinospora rubra]|uniref:hypothetical protein n=1 Tax=Thermoactinospora rubra TaxID=1088767 RepID=UPI000A104BE5|nr:hypothetical protein [Thermoactinospora rubra]